MGMNIATNKKMERFTDLRVIIRRGHANLLCIDPILVYVLPWQAQDHWFRSRLSVHLASLQALTKVIGNWARVKTWHANLLQNGAWPLHFKNTRGGRKGKENKKRQRGRLGVCCRKLRTFTDFSGAAVKYLSSKGDGTDFKNHALQR